MTFLSDKTVVSVAEVSWAVTDTSFDNIVPGTLQIRPPPRLESTNIVKRESISFIIVQFLVLKKDKSSQAAIK